MALRVAETGEKEPAMVDSSQTSAGLDSGDELYPQLLGRIARHYAESAWHLEAEREIATAERLARLPGGTPVTLARVLGLKMDVCRELGRLEEASDALEEAFEVLPRGSSDSPIWWDLRWREAVLSLAEGNPEMAEDELSLCLEEGTDRLGNPARWRIWHFLGLANLALHRFERAPRCFAEAHHLYAHPHEDLRAAERWWAYQWLEARTGTLEAMEASFRFALDHLRKAERSDLAVLLTADLARHYRFFGHWECAAAAGRLVRQLDFDFGWLSGISLGALFSEMTACGANLLVLEGLPRRLADGDAEG